MGVSESFGPAAHPRDVAGYTFQSPELQECPFPFYEALREQAPVYRIPGRPEYLVARWEDITYVAQHPELFSSVISEKHLASNPAVGGADTFDSADTFDFGYSPSSMALCDPPENKMKRAVGAKLVGRERLAEYEPMVRQHTDQLIDAFIDRGEAEFVSDFAFWLPVKVIIDILGLARKDLILLKRLGDRPGQGVRFMTPAELEQEDEVQRELVEYLTADILDRYENPRDDGLGQLVSGQVERDGRLNLPYLKSEVGTLLFAGNTSTSHMLANTMLLLLQNPDQLELVRDDRSLVRPLIEEALRLESPVQWTQRTATQDVEIAGVPIPAGSILLLLWASGNRDPGRWDDPDRFSVERPNIAKHQLGFGRGTHLCLGAPLARLEGEVAFNRIFDRTTNLRLAPRKNDFTHVTVPHLRGPKAVHIKFDPLDA